MTTDDIRKELNQIDERTHRKMVHYIQTRCCPEDIAEECVHGGETERVEGDEAKKKADVRRNWRGEV